MKSGLRHPGKQPRKTYGVSPSDFVRAWRSSRTLPEVAAKLGMPLNRVAGRVGFYRRRGIDLPKLRRASRRAKIDVERLNSIIATGRGEGEPGAPLL